MNRRRFLAAVTAGAAGLAGCAGADTDPTPRPTDTPTPTDEPTPTDTPGATGTPTETPTPTPTPVVPDVTVVTGPNGDLVFRPRDVTIASGDTVLWTWDSGGHNVKPTSQPAGADWTGTPGGRLFGKGHEYAYTFEVTGTYEYECVPHAGMVGSVVVE